MRIPVGNFGNQTAQAAPGVRVPTGAFVDGSAEAMQQTGRQLSGIGADLLEAQSRAQTLRQMTESKGALVGLQDEISRSVEAGDLDPAKAQTVWDERSKKLMGDQLSKVAMGQRDTVGAQLGELGQSLGFRVRDAATKRTQQNIGGDLTALGIALERENDPAKASALYDQSVRAMGPSAGWAPAQIENNINTFREKAYATKAYSLVNGARNSMAELNKVESMLNSEEFAALDPQRRAVLLNTTTGYKTALEQRAVAQAQRAEIQAAKRDRQAAGVYTQAVTLATEGKKLDPNWIAGAAEQVAGTPYEAGFKAAVEQAPAGTAFAMQPLNIQKELLDGLQAEGSRTGWTPTRQAMYDNMQKSYEASEREYKEDPLRAAVDRGVLPELAPLDVSNGVDGIVQSVDARLQQSQQVEVVTGTPVSPFTPEEAMQVGTALKAMPVDQRAASIAALSRSVGQKTMGAIAAQIDSKDRALSLASAIGGQQLPNGGLVAERVLRGEQAIQDKRIVDADINRWRAEAAAELDGVFASNGTRRAMIDAAVFVRADAEVRREGRSMRNAIEAVTGSIVEFNGGKIPLPLGMTESQFERGLVALTPDSFTDQAPDGNVFVAGRAIPVSEFVKGLPNAVLRHAGQGRYTVSSGTGDVLNQAGQPVIVRVGNGTR
ncbi:hypothetical protein [Achromobacter sp.]|uniref:hypothetical protein n=1 Tax=Achromobacter sp. TaxID=134375 RepID=UPI000ECABB88|nr:hypothetical protein [Achromobacter sp.]HCW18833.1 hypothetical protein [Achromobacter sp.]